MLESGRLKYRKLTLDDVEPLYGIIGKEENMIFYPRPFTVDETEEWINRNIKSYSENGFGLYAVIDKVSNQFIGQCGISLQDINGVILPEIGYQIKPEFRNQGIATESARYWLNQGVENLGLENIFIHTYVKNVPSQRVAVKIGMKYLGEYDKYMPRYNLIWKHVIFSNNT
ncbi:GNAT family N-acetyltransferase [Marinigracilibium pacificum]|uniref:GNAT family N-acetyltransferase n=1 Tax=Marinigracilibium pacificum TaxID=2729599 RepID=A0A848J1T3_9BACT|nr:GNAT family N-acetyltransferase [Marinigracilibium pacificum]NMM48500.1 GNAT family N-acetyltransferase [Marinigracilibium pacificum]